MKASKRRRVERANARPVRTPTERLHRLDMEGYAAVCERAKLYAIL